MALFIVTLTILALPVIIYYEMSEMAYQESIKNKKSTESSENSIDKD